MVDPTPNDPTLTRMSSIVGMYIDGLSQHSGRCMAGAGAALAMTFSSLEFFERSIWHPFPAMVLLILFALSLGLAFGAENRASRLRRALSANLNSSEPSIDEVNGLFDKSSEPQSRSNQSAKTLLVGIVVAILFVPVASCVG